ncbi:MAG: MATE family efflux transporter [Oscillospiraceae bacterium]
MVKDMTKGSVIKLLISFAVPMLLGNVFQQLYSAVDTWAVGRGVGVNALAAVGSTGSLNWMVLGFVTGLTHGFSILISQSFGRKDDDAVRKSVTGSAYLSLLISVVVSILGVVFARPLLMLMNTPADILEDACLYISLIFGGMLTAIFYNLAASILRALGDSVSPLIIIIISSLVNVGLDLLFVMVFHWGVAGVAVATLIAQLLSGLLCLLVLRRIPLLKMAKSDWRPEKAVLFELLHLGIPVGLMNSVTAVGMLILQWIVNGFGAVTVAAYTVVSKLIGFAEQPSNIIGFSLGTFVGQNLGAGKISRLREGVKKAALLSTGVSLTVGGLLIAFGRQLTGFFVSPEETAVIETAYPFLVLVGISLVILGYLFLFRFSLQGMGDTLLPLLSGVLELALRISIVFLIPLSWGFWRISIAEVSAWAGAAILLGIGYFVRIRKLAPSISRP